MEKFMERAITLGMKGVGKTSPNPLVGAVIVKDGKIIGEGYHERYGGLHGERNAIKDCLKKGNSTNGATLYVTLEPCCHYGKTPPCTNGIIEAGIEEVIIGSLDPNPAVSGKGVKILRDNGIKVKTGFLKERCDQMNEIFFHYIKTGKPFVLMKYGETLDGKIATATGESKWITCEESRRMVHEDRNRYTGIMVGLETARKDNPSLTARIPGGIDPVRIVCDTDLKIPEDLELVKTANKTKTIIATCNGFSKKAERLREMGCEILNVSKDRNGHTDIREVIDCLGEMGIDSILLEGGGNLNWSALNAGCVNKVKTFIAPKILGGNGVSPVTGKGTSALLDCIKLEILSVSKIGEDILIESKVVPCLQD